MKDTFEIRLTGEGMKPGLVRSHELAELMEAIEDLVTAETLKHAPDVKRDELIVGLYEIADKSVGLKFKTTLASLVIPIFTAATTAVAENRFDDLTPQTIKSLHTISNFTKRHQAKTEFKTFESVEPIAVISPETIIPVEFKITGQTELFAKILRVGGKVA